MKVIRKLLSKYDVILSDDSVGKLASTMERKEYQKEERILDQGQTCHSMYIVEKGMIRQFYYKDGRDITEHFSHEGDVATCIESLILKEPTNLLIEAIEPSIVYLLNYAKWETLCDEYSDINKLYRRIIEYKLVVSQRKADSWRFESSRERYERFCQENPAIARRASIAHIASYLLMSPETLSRVRAGIL